MATKESVKVRLERLVTEYGSVALLTYLGLFALVLTGFAVAIKLGVAVESSAGNATVLGAAYVATKLTTPLRIGATVVLTPIVARLRQRMRGLPPVPTTPALTTSDEASASSTAPTAPTAVDEKA